MLENNGGRIEYPQGKKVRILLGNNTPSKDVYVVETTRSDRKGHMILLCPNGGQKKVHFKRILPETSNQLAVVLELNSKLIASCPECGRVEQLSDRFECKDHGEFELLWLTDKPSSQAKSSKLKEVIVSSSNSKCIKNTKKESIMKQRPIVDIESIAKTPHCELWLRQDLTFDHATIDVKAYVLLFVGKNPRKLCFNTYDGILGKRANNLPIKEFLENSEESENRVWYSVKDLEKEKQKLANKGYDKVPA